jgi:uncharacterized protein (DUF58 family)
MDDARALFAGQRQERLRAILVAAAVAGLAAVALRQPVLALASFAIALTLTVGFVWQRFGLVAVGYCRLFSQSRAFPGEELWLELSVENNKLLPLPWLEVEDEFPADLAFPGLQLDPSPKPKTVVFRTLFSLRSYERVRRRYRLVATRRGYYRFSRARLRTSDPFGLALASREETTTNELIVYPAIRPLPSFGLPAKQPLGERRPVRPLTDDPTRYRGVRPYVPGDLPRRIHWRATARTGDVQSKQFEQAATPTLALFLDINTFEHYWEGLDPEKLERAISLCASLAAWGLEERYQVGLYVNAPRAGGERFIRLLPSRHPRQLQRILESLALLVPYTGYRIELLVAAESRLLPWGASVVVITSLVTEALRRTLLALRGQGQVVTLLAVGVDPGIPSLPGLSTHRIEEGSDGTPARSTA